MKVKKSDTSIWVVSSILILTLLLNIVIFSMVFLENCPQNAGLNGEKSISKTAQTCEKSLPLSFFNKAVDLLKGF